MLTRVVIINDLSRAAGGATSLALLSARLLRARGMAVTFVTGDTAERHGALEEMGVEVVSLNSAPLLERGRMNAMLVGLYNPAAFALLRSWISRNDGAGVVYHLHTWSRILSPAVFRALRPVAGRTLVHAHDAFIICPNGLQFDFQKHEVCDRLPLSFGCICTHCDKRSYSQKLWRSLRHGVRRLFFNPATTLFEVLMIHPNMRKEMRRAGLRAQSLYTLRNPAEPFTTACLTPERRKQFFLISRLDAEKGFEDAAAAARLARVPLTVIGDGPGGALLRSHYPEVRHLGWCSKSQIGELLAEARAVVMPSRGPEPFGMAAIEAAGSGLPIILNDQANIASEAVEGGFALAFQTGSVPALAATMRALADDDDLVARMASCARLHARRMALDEEAWCDQLLDRYTASLMRVGDAVPVGNLGWECRL